MDETLFNLVIEYVDEAGVYSGYDWDNISYYKVRSIVDEWMSENVVNITVNRV